jgi:tripartite-type tricarboxylate transporter receptor subunit TctC
MQPIHLAVCTGLMLGTSIATAPGAQSFPARPVRYIMPLPAGQETDVFARVLARRLTDGWGQNVIVDNRPGGGTVIATDLAAKAAPDGYTLLHALTAHAINVTLRTRLPYDTLKDFACVTQLSSFSGVLIAHPSFPAKSVAELITLAKAQPGQIVYATGPVGTTNHILGEALNTAAGISIGHVPYKGGGPAIQDLLAGRVPLVSNVVLEVLPFIRSGKVRPIAVTGPKRTPSLPDVPTVGESLPAYQSGTSFWALLARAGTPAAVVKQINADVLKAMQVTDVRERIAQMDVEPVGSTPAQCDAFLRAQVETWGRIVRASGAKAG